MYSGKKIIIPSKYNASQGNLASRHKYYSNVDFKLFKLTNPNLKKARFILADGGYQGIKNIYSNVFTPLKATKKYPLAQEAKCYNSITV